MTDDGSKQPAERSAFRKVLEAGLKAAGLLALSGVVEAALTGSLGGLVGKALGGGIAAAAGKFLDAYDGKANPLDPAVDRLMAAKARAAGAQLHVCLRCLPRTSEEAGFREAKLLAASHNLDEAFELARTDEERDFVRGMQCIATALHPGGRVFIDLYLQNFRRRAEDAVQALNRARREEEEHRAAAREYVAAQRAADTLPSALRTDLALPAQALASQEYSESARCRELREQAEHFLLFVEFVELIAAQVAAGRLLGEPND